jgi:hypothetical protein
MQSYLKSSIHFDQRLRAPAERRVHRSSESAQRLVAGHDAFGQGVLGEVGAQARHGVSEAAHAHADECALFCQGKVFVPALHLTSCALSFPTGRGLARLTTCAPRASILTPH